ncbi:Orotidine 5'-phosphate decarboxylase [Geodia barretti]|uniref:Orotidine 5'-phosphate decarboxylase n=2 Tax=Geodia barretti TaxID=519541 RepID=A0AA35TFE6_GEOBA|nr:Orotidine 5'-phosphate decarboxylase [Geodia barretti]
MPVPDVFVFNRAIIDSTAAVASAYKPNLAFYEALGLPGMEALERTVSHIRDVAPDAVIIGDAKRGDIGPSARAYAKAMFGFWDFDAVTVNAWGGSDSIEPFLEDPTRGVFVWCRGSNPGSGDFQDLLVDGKGEGTPLYEAMARACADWNTSGNIGLVVGATVPGQLAAVRSLCPDMPLLIPGVGAQGGELESAVRAGCDSKGRLALINSSRGVIYASPSADFASAASEAASRLRDSINHVLEQDGLGWLSS